MGNWTTRSWSNNILYYGETTAKRRNVFDHNLEEEKHSYLEMADAEMVVETEKQPDEISAQKDPAAEALKSLMENENTESVNEGKITVDSLEELSAVEGDGTINEEAYGEWHPLVDMSSASLFNASEMEESSVLPLSLKLPGGEDSTISVQRDDHSSTFLEMEFESEEMKKFLAYQQKTQPKYTSIEDMMYKPTELFPDW